MTATQQPVGVELIEVDPHTLDVGKNVRDQVDLEATPGFVASVREHGVLHPITANRREDGVLVVIDGQRRTFPRKWPCCIDVSWRASPIPAATPPGPTGRCRGCRPDSRRRFRVRRCAGRPDSVAAAGSPRAGRR